MLNLRSHFAFGAVLFFSAVIRRASSIMSYIDTQEYGGLRGDTLKISHFKPVVPTSHLGGSGRLQYRKGVKLID